MSDRQARSAARRGPRLAESIAGYAEARELEAALSHRKKYDEAVSQWAYCIAVDNGLQGITMGRVFALSDVLGINANQVVADLREAQAQIKEVAT